MNDDRSVDVPAASVPGTPAVPETPEASAPAGLMGSAVPAVIGKRPDPVAAGSPPGPAPGGQVIEGTLAGTPDSTVSASTAARIAASVPDATRRAYAGDWNRFTAWCSRTGRTALPASAETLAEYVSALADEGKAPATITRAIAGVRTAHRVNGLTPPDTTAARAVRKAYRGERAAAGLPNQRQAAALAVSHLRRIAAALDTGTAIDLRDRLTVVLGWAMMARRSELAGLDLGDVVEVEQGLVVTVRRSKTDQAATGRQVAVPYGSDPLTCPVRALRAWRALLAERGSVSGPLLRRVDRRGVIAGVPGAKPAGGGPADGRLSGHSIGQILTRAARRAGLAVDDLSAHSLRAGGATGAYTAGADLVAIGRHGGWRDGSSELLKYIRDVDRWKHNPMHGAGL
ncbi:site-specific integrase [Planobispora longispora]|uniref:Integrase n=1 Tax=Planobispora longispora TaxID=28887 RepID=A0A8J3W9N3_9ACTN|nr:site-specific integrase [Planobispora longispora]BFE89269.1 site-specific integrase [Planobispora longispora]GIH80988.1 integrase [Planobispora longispora]